MQRYAKIVVVLPSEDASYKMNLNEFKKINQK